MKCIKCGEEVKKNDKFCPKCGEKTNVNKDELLVKAYIGDGYESIKEENFSIPAFLLGPIYMFYRKLYAYGALSVLLILLFLNLDFVYNMAVIIACLTFDMLFGIFFNKFYMKEVKRRVNIIKNRNDGTKEEELIKICKERGRTSVIAPIIYVLTIILGIGLVLLYDYTYEIEPIASMYYLSGLYDDSVEIDDDDEDWEESSVIYDKPRHPEPDKTTDCDVDEEESTDCIDPIELSPTDDSDEEPTFNPELPEDRIVIQEDGE